MNQSSKYLVAAALGGLFAAAAPTFAVSSDDGAVVIEQPKINPASIQLAPEVSNKINPRTAVRKTPAKEVDLPGVMKVSGADAKAVDWSRTQIVGLSNGDNKTVYIGDHDWNLVQLPFDSFKVVGQNNYEIQKGKGGNLFVSLKADAPHSPATFYFEAEDGVVFGLQLVPKGITSQRILVRDDAGTTGRIPEMSSDSGHVANVQRLMQLVATGSSPVGYSVTDLKTGPISKDGLVINPVRRYSNRSADIFLYEVTNPLDREVRLREEEFDQPRVQAVSIQVPTLQPNQTTNVIVMARKEGNAQ